MIFSKNLVLPTLLVLLVACGGGTDSDLDPNPGKKAEVVKYSALQVAGFPDGANLVACLDENADYACDSEGVNASELKIASNIAEGALVLIKQIPDATVGSSVYEQYEGTRTYAVQANTYSASPFDALAHGLWVYTSSIQAAKSTSSSQEIPSLDTVVKRLVKTPADAKAYLTEKYKLTSNAKINKAILQALDIGQEELGKQGFAVENALPAINQMVIKGLFQHSNDARISCASMPTGCDGVSSDDPYPVVDLSQIESYPSAVDAGTSCVRYAYGNCIEWAGKPPVTGIFVDLVEINSHKAALAAHQTNLDRKILMPHQQAFSGLQCSDNTSMHIYMYGTPDNFDTTNNEPTNPQGSGINLLNYLSAISTSLSFHSSYPTRHLKYDEIGIPGDQGPFVDTLSGVPPTLSSGKLVIGLKENGYPFNNNNTLHSRLSIGDLLSPNAAYFNESVSNIRNNWQSHGSDVYSQDLNTIQTHFSGSILARFQSAQPVHIAAAYIAGVDFVAVATCEPTPDPTPTLPSVTNTLAEIKADFSCPAEQTYHEIIGGDFDDFTGGADPATAGSYLSSFANIEYDTPVEKAQTFADSLNISFPNHTVTRAQLVMNTRQSVPSALPNDYFAMGNFNNGNVTTSPNVAAGHPTNSASYSHEIAVQNGGTVKIIYDLINFYNVSSAPPVQTGTMLDFINSSATNLDIIIGEKKEVDGTMLQTCLTLKCIDTDGDGFCDKDEKEAGSDPSNASSTPNDLDGDGVPNSEDCDPNNPKLTVECELTYTGNLPAQCNQNFSFDLHDRNTWTFDSGAHPTVHNEFANHPTWPNIIWDGDMDNDNINNGANDTWFNFGNTPNTTHKLSKSFCACGGVRVNVTDMKSDNTGYIDIIKTDTTQWSNRIVSRTAGHSQETMASWAGAVSGSRIIGGTGGGVNYTLEFGVTNFSGPSGGAVQGKLDYIGHEGSCTTQDNLDTGVDINWPVPILTGDVVYVISNITFTKDEGTAPSGVVNFEVALPITSVAENGAISIIPQPEPITVNVNTGNSETLSGENLKAGASCKDGKTHILWSGGDKFYQYEAPMIGCTGSWQTKF